MRSALVTGGAGFIGSHIVDRLVELGHRVAIVDDLSTGIRGNLNEAASFHEADIRDAERIRAVFEAERPDLVYHLAAQSDVRRSVANPVYDAQCNVIGSLNVLEACRAVGVGKLIFSSTGGAIYGDPDHLPVGEDHPARPMSPYGASKLAVEGYLHQYRASFGVSYTVLRYGNVYGPRQNPKGEAGVVAIFARMMLEGRSPTIFGDGGQTRDYLYVGDAVEANMLAMRGGDGCVFNVGTGVETSVLELYGEVKDATGFAGDPVFAPERLGEVHRTSVDASYIARELGFQPRVCFAEGVSRSVEFYRQQRLVEA
jgi:UDP-glucose 4-epimerase